MKKINMILAASAVTSSLMSGEVLAADPTAVNVTAYKTEVCTDAACSTILDDVAGVAAELVGGTGAFGSNPSVATGSYNRFRFTLKNEISVTGSPGGACAAAATTTTLIDSSLAPTDQVTVAFATADAAIPGSTGWYANGSDAHPLIMSAPVVVSADGTTNVTIQFNTAGTLSCVGTTATIAAPSFNVTSYEQPTAAASFTGGDYWIVGTNVHNPWLSAESLITANSLIPAASWPPADIAPGQMIEPGIASDGTSIYQALLSSADAAKYQAQIRARTTREVRWGMKVSLGAPNTVGEGSVSLIRDPGWQRFAPVFSAGNESFIAAPIADVTPTVAGTYHLDSNNRLTLFIDGSSSIQGAFSDDYQTLVVGETSDGIGLSMGVKVATGITALPNNIYSWNSYMVELGRNDDPFNNKGSNGTVIDGDEALHSSYHGSVGWIDATVHTSASMATIGARQELQNPDLTTFTSTNSLSDEGETAQDFSSILSGFIDGAGMVGPGLENWMAVSPSGQVAIMTGAAEFDARFSDDAYVAGGSVDPMYDFWVRKNSSFNILVQLAPTGSQTMAGLAGTYFISGVWDSLDAGNSSFGGSVGEVTLNADGTGTVNITDVDNLNRISGGSQVIGWEILNACIGVSGVPGTFARMDINSLNCVADGGKIVDAIVAYDPLTPTQHQVAIFPSADGKALTYFDPQGLDVTQTSRSLGLGVKLR
ncbi:MAG: hypothetical protein OEY06_04985 [Gammaproteobacteria bacterium]|nr:hypothetical protein [Gammaproteobacteria bacterium]